MARGATDPAPEILAPMIVSIIMKLEMSGVKVTRDEWVIVAHPDTTFSDDEFPLDIVRSPHCQRDRGYVMKRIMFDEQPGRNLRTN